MLGIIKGWCSAQGFKSRLFGWKLWCFRIPDSDPLNSILVPFEILELKPRYYLLTLVALGLSFQFSGSRDVTSLPLVVVCLYELALDTDTRPPLPRGLTYLYMTYLTSMKKIPSVYF